MRRVLEEEGPAEELLARCVGPLRGWKKSGLYVPHSLVLGQLRIKF